MGEVGSDGPTAAPRYAEVMDVYGETSLYTPYSPGGVYRFKVKLNATRERSRGFRPGTLQSGW